MKHKIKKAEKLYYPKFSHFQMAYMKLQRGVSFACALAGLVFLFPFFLFLCMEGGQMVVWVALEIILT